MRDFPLLAPILAILLLFAGCRHKPKDYHIGRSVPASYINVLSGAEFDVKLQDGERIHAFLTVGAAPQAKEKVTKLINNVYRPEVTFLGKVDKGWVVDIRFLMPICNGTSCVPNEQSLADWLRKNGLAWE